MHGDSSSIERVPRRMLLVRPSALGDVCRTVPVLTTLRRAFPEAVIDWVVRDAYVEAVASHPGLDEVIAFPRDKPGDVWRMMREVRQRNYDTVIDLQGLARSGLITRYSGAVDRVGFANAREGAMLAYHRRRRFAIDKTMHTVDRMLGLVGAAWPGIEIVRDLRLHVATQDRAVVPDDMVGAGYVCLAPTAQWLCKCWPIGHYVEIARRLLARDADQRIVVLAAPSERGVIAPLLDALGDHAHWPRTTVGQMLAWIERARLLICNDSAPLHMGVGLDRPLIALFGPTDPARVGPYRRQADVLQPPNLDPAAMTRYRRRRDDQTLIAQLSVETVWQAVVERLECHDG